MGISGYTATVLATRDDLIVTHGGPAKKNGKYVGWIMLPEDRWAPLLNTEPIFDTPEAAEEHMHELMKQIKEHMEKKMKGRDPVSFVIEEAEKRDA